MQKIKIGLLGLGRTGKIVAQSLFKDERFDFVFAVKNNTPRIKDYCFSVETKEVLPKLIKEFQPDIIVDFTTPEATLKNIKTLPDNIGVVVATTGFSDKQIIELKHNSLKVLYAPNISDGINILMSACKTIDNLWQNADVEIIEQHFNGKKDAPSGTAKKIANIFEKNVPIHSVRAGGIVGIHKVIFARPNQKITITHESFSKEVFAEGAKRAILWLYKQEPGFYEMSEIFDGK